MILSAAVWCGEGCLNSPIIDDITRHPFTTSLPYTGANHKSSADSPVLAVCTQLINLCTSSRRIKSSNTLENSASSCVRIGSYPDTIQITSRNHTVHIFQHCSDLHATIRDEKVAKSPPKNSDIYLKMMRALVGFGAGKGGRWVQIGYMGSGGSSRCISPLLISRASRVERSLSHSQPTDTAGDSGLHPISATLCLFQALSSVPDIFLARPAQSAPAKDGSSFSTLSLSQSSTDPNDSGSKSSNGGGYGFGFGMLSSKPRPSAGIGSKTLEIKKTGVDVDAEELMSASRLTLSARLNTLLTHCERVMRNLGVSPCGATTHFNDKSESEEPLSTALIALNSIDSDGEEEGEKNACGMPPSSGGVIGSFLAKDMVTDRKSVV